MLEGENKFWFMKDGLFKARLWKSLVTLEQKIWICRAGSPKLQCKKSVMESPGFSAVLSSASASTPQSVP